MAILDRAVAVRAAPFLCFIAFLVLGAWAGPRLEAIGQAEIASWLPVARGFVVAALLAWFWRSYSELRRPDPLHWGWWGAALGTGLAVFVVWLMLDVQWSGDTDPSRGFRPVREDGSIEWTKAIARLAGFALVVPVMEELFWRSLVLRWIDRSDFLSLPPRQVGLRAFVITTVLFAVEHDRWAAGAVAGAAYNLLYMRTGNLWVPVAAHAVTNGALGLWILATGQWHLW